MRNIGVHPHRARVLVKPVRFGVVHYLVEVKPVDLVDEIVSDEVLYCELLLITPHFNRKSRYSA